MKTIIDRIKKYENHITKMKVMSGVEFETCFNNLNQVRTELYNKVDDVNFNEKIKNTLINEYNSFLIFSKKLLLSNGLSNVEFTGILRAYTQAYDKIKFLDDNNALLSKQIAILREVIAILQPNVKPYNMKKHRVTLILKAIKKLKSKELDTIIDV